MNIGPGNIEALLLDALEGRLSVADAELVWAALEAHPEWGVSWDFDDRDLPRLSPDEVPAMDWAGLKKEVVTDTEIRQALRRDRDFHTLDSDVKQSLYRMVGERSRTREERSLWRHWAAAASVALVIGLMWWGNKPTDAPALATQVQQKQMPSTESSMPAIDTTSSTSTPNPSEELKAATQNENIIRAFVADKPIIKNYSEPKEPLNTEDHRFIGPTQNNTENIAQVPDSTSIEAPLELPFKIQEIPLEGTYLAQHIKPNSREISSEPLTPAQWLKMKADQVLRRAEADGTLPTVRREKESFSLEWGSLSINTH
jgi:hypothetical protein